MARQGYGPQHRGPKPENVVIDPLAKAERELQRADRTIAALRSQLEAAHETCRLIGKLVSRHVVEPSGDSVASSARPERPSTVWQSGLKKKPHRAIEWVISNRF
jgi:hypothetical protein